VKKIAFLFVVIATSLFAADQAPLINLSVAQVDQPAQFVKTINIAIILALFVLAPTLLLMDKKLGIQVSNHIWIKKYLMK
jgi:flagellar biosynthetic protein FliP